MRMSDCDLKTYSANHWQVHGPMLAARISWLICVGSGEHEHPFRQEERRTTEQCIDFLVAGLHYRGHLDISVQSVDHHVYVVAALLQI